MGKEHQSKAGKHSNTIMGTHYLLPGDCPKYQVAILSPWAELVEVQAMYI